jgi:phosphoglycerol transferase MdoB-like AlkP superfamily enzyme
MSLNNILTRLYKIILLYFLGLFIFLFFRIYYLISFGNYTNLQNYLSQIPIILQTSLRYDTSVIGYTLLPLFIIFLIGVFLKKQNEKINTIFSFIIRKYSLFSFIILIIISSFDFYFYKTYGHHFSPIIFGLKDDATSSILVSLWNDYPVIKLFIFWIICFYLIKNLLKKIDKQTIPIHFNYSLSVIVAIIFSLLYLIGLRGTLTSHGLDLRHASITDNQFLNEMTINPAFALKEAVSKAQNSKITLDYNKTLVDNGFETISEAKKVFLNSNQNNTALNEALFKITPKNEFLENNPPNVVFILMESLSRHLFDLHSNNCNLLDKLDEQLPYCYTFENTLSSRNLTIHSLENILTGTPYTPISQSPYSNIPLSTGIIRPFKEANYTSHFIYGGLYGWRNIGSYLKTQGFENIITQKELETKYKNPFKFTWGIHDEYLYNETYKILESGTKPQFIFILTISNHTPYKLPDNFIAKPIHFPDSLYDKMRMDKEIVDQSLKAFQYANRQLGLFIEKIRNSSLGENTIIVITGDHNLHRGFKYSKNEEFLAHSVPLIFYIPKKYQPTKKINLNNFGSHKDIFPSIYNLSLSNAKYFNTGENLFNNNDNYSVNDFTFAANKYGAVKIGDSTQFYKWSDSSKILLNNTKRDKHLDSLLRLLKSYKAVMGYTIQKELSSKNGQKEDI